MNNRVCCWILAIVGVGFVLFVGLIIVGVMGASALLSSGMNAGIPIEKDSYLTIKLSGSIDESREQPPFAQFVGGGGSATMTDILIALKRAAKDHRITGVILRPSGSSGFAELREIREAVLDFKKSGKPVYAYLEVATDRDYYLASVADSIVIFPARSGGMHFEGLGSSRIYWAQTFEKLGIKFHVLHAGVFKGAYENLAKDKMSPEIRESLQFVYDDLFETYVRETDSSRAKLRGSAFREEVLNGKNLLISGEAAMKSGFADGLDDWMDFSSGLAVGKELHEVSVEDFVAGTHSSIAGKHVAVIFAEGPINYSLDGSELGGEEGVNSDEMIDMLHELRDDDNVQAVVLRVNSPGGSALASELILREILRLKEKKPVIVSMGHVAASGGYYIASGANWIIAQPNTITGSIGVVSAFPTAEELFQKTGMNVETVQKGKWAEFFRVDKTLTAEQEAALTSVMSGIYDDFKVRVSEGRTLTLENVETIAQGRVWTGNQALERKLIDELGGIREAVNKAAELAEIDSSDLHVRYYRGEEDLLHFLMRRLNISLRSTWYGFIGTEASEAMKSSQRLLTAFVERRDFVQLWCPLAFDF